MSSLIYTTHTTDELERLLRLDSPIWHNFKTYANIYNAVSAVRTVIDVKAQAMANVKFIVRDIDTQEIIPFNSDNKLANKLYNLLANPNPLQSTKEWVRAESIYYDVFGKSFTYASVPFGKQKYVRLDNIDTLTPLPAHNMRTYYTGMYFDALSVSDIIDHYEWRDRSTMREFVAETILLRTNVVMDIPSLSNNGDMYANELSKLYSLQKEISNFVISLESRNVMGKKRGALGVWVSGMKTNEGIMPLADKQKLDAQNALSQYGTLEHQNQFVLTSAPLKFEKTAISPKELMLLEESWQDVVAIANSYGVPDVLVKLHIAGATFENQKEAEKRLYQRTVIPEMKDKVADLAEFLKLKDYGLTLEASYDHVAVLQENQKERAGTEKIKSATGKELFMAGIYTPNDWLTSLDKLAIEDDWANKRITEMTDREIGIVTGKFSFTIDKSQEEPVLP